MLKLLLINLIILKKKNCNLNIHRKISLLFSDTYGEIEGYGELILTETIHDRKQMMADKVSNNFLQNFFSSLQ
jgi:hypothetical protein